MYSIKQDDDEISLLSAVFFAFHSTSRSVHGNGNSHSHGIPMGMGVVFGLLMGTGMGLVLMGMEIAYFIDEK